MAHNKNAIVVAPILQKWSYPLFEEIKGLSLIEIKLEYVSLVHVTCLQRVLSLCECCYVTVHHHHLVVTFKVPLRDESPAPYFFLKEGIFSLLVVLMGRHPISAKPI
jgi:hypothetical protein